MRLHLLGSAFIWYAIVSQTGNPLVIMLTIYSGLSLFIIFRVAYTFSSVKLQYGHCISERINKTKWGFRALPEGLEKDGNEQENFHYPSQCILYVVGTKWGLIAVKTNKGFSHN